MSISKYVSEVKTIDQNQEVVYRFLSNFENLGTVFNDQILEKISAQVPQVSISDFHSEKDRCWFTLSGYGEAGFRILEREEPKMIKISGTGKIPFEVFLWIQLLPVTPYQCKMRLTLHAGLNMMMKMMVGKKLEEAVNKLADTLAMIPFR
ncbi:MAG TPA: hypothetical protein PLK12_09560 [Prolixibacteraceae bacterium]|nr:hypothetical protein [Prolixibacteraceae bacterium]